MLNVIPLFAGLVHLGVIKALNECKLLPRIISGASSGSIMAAFVCTKTDAELPHVLSDVSSLDLVRRYFVKSIHSLYHYCNVYEFPYFRTCLKGQRSLTHGLLV
jgi:predicted acylesterase/phospholipase RssA